MDPELHLGDSDSDAGLGTRAQVGRPNGAEVQK